MKDNCIQDLYKDLDPEDLEKSNTEDDESDKEENGNTDELYSNSSNSSNSSDENEGKYIIGHSISNDDNIDIKETYYHTSNSKENNLDSSSEENPRELNKSSVYIFMYFQKINYFLLKKHIKILVFIRKHRK